jgi:hypothetical protein
VPTYWAGNTIFEGVTETNGVGVAVPFKLIVSGLSAAFSVIPIAKLKLPSGAVPGFIRALSIPSLLGDADHCQTICEEIPALKPSPPALQPRADPSPRRSYPTGLIR